MRNLLCILLLFFASVASAQPKITVAREDADIFIHEWDTDGATVSITDPKGLAIRTLEAKDFTVRHDSVLWEVTGIEQSRITNAKRMSLSFVIDNSASIFAGYDSITKYLDAFIRNIPGSVLMGAYVFDNKDRTPMHEPTRRGEVYIASSGETESRDTISRFWHFYDTIRSTYTPLYDQVGVALWNIQRRKNYGDKDRLNIVIVISDGTDNASRTSIETLDEIVGVSDVRLFVLTYRTEPDRRLSWLANRARGSGYTLDQISQISQALDELRNEFTYVYKLKFKGRQEKFDLPKAEQQVRENKAP